MLCLFRWRKKYWLSLAWQLNLVLNLDFEDFDPIFFDLAVLFFILNVLLNFQRRAVGGQEVLLHFSLKGVYHLEVKAGNLVKHRHSHLWSHILPSMILKTADHMKSSIFFFLLENVFFATFGVFVKIIDGGCAWGSCTNVRKFLSIIWLYCRWQYIVKRMLVAYIFWVSFVTLV